MFWQFWRVLVRYFVGCLSIELFLYFSYHKTGVRGYGEENHRGNAIPFLSQHVKSVYYQHDLWLLMLTLVTWLKRCLLAFYTVKFFFPLSILYSLEGNHPVWPRRSKEVSSTSSKVEYLHQLFRILLCGGFLFSPHVLFYSFIHYILMNSWIFSSYFRSQSKTALSVLLRKLSQLCHRELRQLAPLLLWHIPSMGFVSGILNVHFLF